MEMHPYPRLRRYFPRRGKFALLSAFGLIQYEQHFGELAASGGFFPLWCLRHHLPPAKAVGQQPVLCLEQHLKQQSRGALLCPRLREKGGGASHQRGCAFPSPEGRLYGFLFSHGRSPVVKVLSKLAPSIILKAPTTTLSGEAAVKPENPRGESPVKPRPRVGVNLHARRECHSPIKKEAAKAASFFNFISDQPGKP